MFAIKGIRLFQLKLYKITSVWSGWQSVRKQQVHRVLVKMFTRRQLCILLLGLYAVQASIAIGMKLPQKGRPRPIS